jgi:L-threonylcarbamoyladenylate synthase
MSYYGLTFYNREVPQRPMPIIRVDPREPTAPRRALDMLRDGAVVVFPTDTVYGIGCRIDRDEAVRRIFALKGRGAKDPMPVLLADPAQLDTYGREITPAARRLAQQFWPGALTIVVRRSDAVPPLVAGGTETVGLRVPNHPLVRALVRELGVPLVGTSANRHGAPAPVTAQQVAFDLGDTVDLILDGGRTPGGRESTVVDATGDSIRVLRQGAVFVSVAA